MNNNFQTRQQSLRHFRHSLGNRLRQIRTNRKLNIAEAAKLLGRSQEYLIALESGNFANLELSFLHYVAYKYQYKISVKLKKKGIT